MVFRGPGLYRHDELEDQCSRHRICRFGAYDRGRQPEDCLEVRISLPEAGRDSSSTAPLIEYALSYGTFNLAELRMTSRVYSKTVALGSMVAVTRNAGAATKVLRSARRGL
jgi:hypothetical protein